MTSKEIPQDYLYAYVNMAPDGGIVCIDGIPLVFMSEVVADDWGPNMRMSGIAKDRHIELRKYKIVDSKRILNNDEIDHSEDTPGHFTLRGAGHGVTSR